MASEILRPNGPGSETNIDTQFPAGGEHWDKVDDVTPDEDTTYVENKSGAVGVFQRDLYSLPAHTGSGDIQSVSVYVLTKHNASSAHACLKTHGTVYESGAMGGSAWMLWKQEWTTNPFTGAPWTWDEIDDLEIGVSLSGSVAEPDWSRCTQVYAEVIYGPVGISLDLQVAAGAYDCAFLLWLGAWAISTADTTQFVGYANPNARNYGGGMVFQNVTIPQGATITRAYLVLTPKSTDLFGMIKSVIIGEAVDDAAPFSTLANYQARRGTIVGGPNDDNITSAYVNWDYIHSWALDVEETSPDIAAIIQEIINRSGWVSGNSLNIFWDDHANRSTATLNTVRLGYSFDGSAAKAPQLHIEYIPPTRAAGLPLPLAELILGS